MLQVSLVLRHLAVEGVVSACAVNRSMRRCVAARGPTLTEGVDVGADPVQQGKYNKPTVAPRGLRGPSVGLGRARRVAWASLLLEPRDAPQMMITPGLARLATTAVLGMGRDLSLRLSLLSSLSLSRSIWGATEALRRRLRNEGRCLTGSLLGAENIPLVPAFNLGSMSELIFTSKLYYTRGFTYDLSNHALP